MKRWQVAGILIAIGAGFFIVIKTSHAGVSKIMIHEDLRLKPYKDVAGHWTIGYGHKLLPGEWYDEITKEKAEQLLRQDLAVAENAVNVLVTVPLTQNQFDALVSFVYNIGAGAFADSTMLRKLNAGDYDGAAAEFPRWKYSGGEVVAGLIARREKEQALFMAA